jgi:DNA-binding NarL/FixJ family response regulator
MPSAVATVCATGEDLTLDQAVALAFEQRPARRMGSTRFTSADQAVATLLSARVAEVAVQLAHGLSNHQIGERLAITERTVKAPRRAHPE